ncbi:MAG: phosphoglycerate dehydrogenase [Endomicrobiales bacterium]|nr:phosphoglycerate dehydrogenase [Endomicrobiales bacterium]
MAALQRKDNTMYKIMMTYKNTEGLEELLNNKEFKIDIHQKPTPEQFKELIANYDGLLIRSGVKVTADIIGAAKNLKFIGRAGTGVDNVDIPAATQKGIVVANVPGGNTISAAEHTVGLILALARNIPQAYQSLKGKKWDRKSFVGTELQGKVLGLVGLGRIGREVAQRMISFGMKVIAHDPFVSSDFVKSLGIELKSLDEVYGESDYISIHSPLNDNTRGMINKEAMKKMKKGIRIINCARGPIINEKDLSEAIKEGHVKGAAIDVFAKEPPEDWTIVESENVVVTPHLAASTEEAQVKIAQEMSGVVIDYFTKGLIRNGVNVPALDWESYKKIEPYIDLAERIGTFQSQVIEGGIISAEIEYAGDIINLNTNPVMIGYLKGLLSKILDIPVNFVNAPVLAKERGIKVKEIRTQEIEDFTSLITAKVKTDKDELVVSGTLFGHKNPRFVRIRGLNVDVIPRGSILMLTNIDRPGVIGHIGSMLGKNNINIAEMQVGRKEIGGEAVTIVNVDNRVTPDMLSQVSNFSGITKVKYIEL